MLRHYAAIDLVFCKCVLGPLPCILNLKPYPSINTGQSHKLLLSASDMMNMMRV